MALRLPRVVAELAADLGELVFPRICLTCERLLPRRAPGVVCAPCWAKIETLPSPRCERCGHPQLRAECRWCRNLDEAVVAARSWCWAGDPVASRAIHALKYHDWPVIARQFAEGMARLRFPPAIEARARVLLPVPLSARRLRERGYNQSFVLANAVSHLQRARVVDGVLVRTRETPTQTRLTPEQRLTNVANAFRIDATRLSGHGDAAVVLVDDVITTGATLNACARALAEAGVQQICYLTFGRARDPRDAPLSTGKTPHGTQGWH
jgi:ComF family protein